MNGLEATALIKTQPNAPCIVNLTLNNSSEHRVVATAAGADDFITELDLGTTLLPSIVPWFA
jgi:CheY-like chemotaxis protein